METWASPYLAAQAAYLRYLATAPAATVLEADGVYAVRTGVASNSENGAISPGDVAVEAEVARRVVGWFQEPAAWLCAEGEARSATARLLEAFGCRPERTAWEMRARLDQLDLDDLCVPAGVRIEPVPAEHGRDIVRYAARHRDAAVGTASAFYGAPTVLLTGVSVVETARRRGIGRALALTRLREARERGCKLAVLAASPEGARLYEALGFETHRQPANRCFYLPPTAPADRPRR